MYNYLDEVVANSVVAEQNNLKDRGVHKGWDVVGIISTSKIFSLQVFPIKLLPTAGSHLCKEAQPNCVYGWLGRFSVMPKGHKEKQ